jgi:hypothetical protein
MLCSTTLFATAMIVVNFQPDNTTMTPLMEYVHTPNEKIMYCTSISGIGTGLTFKFDSDKMTVTSISTQPTEEKITE